MNLAQVISVLGPQKSEDIAFQAALALGISWESEMDIIFRVCLNDPDRCPNKQSKTATPEEIIHKWVKQYKRGYDNRPSQSVGNPPQTASDIIIDEIIGTRIPFLNKHQINEIKYAHRLSMSVENLLGLLLEEYLATKLKPFGWACAWGQTLKAVDLCHKNGQLLQVKNRSNTENSSSNKIRTGSKIKLWYRIDAKTGDHLWENLQKELDVEVSETDFREFVVNVVVKNPNLLVLDRESPFGNN